MRDDGERKNEAGMKGLLKGDKIGRIIKCKEMKRRDRGDKDKYITTLIIRHLPRSPGG